MLLHSNSFESYWERPALLVSLLVLSLAACKRGTDGPDVSPQVRRVRDLVATEKVARDMAIPELLGACPAPVPHPLRLVRRGKGGSGVPNACEGARYGDEEAFRGLREPYAQGDWAFRTVAEAETVTLFVLESERAPQVAGATLIPGQVTGRVVVFDAAGAPRCQAPVSVEGPDKAWNNGTHSNADARRGLCEKLNAAVGRALAGAGGQTPHAPH